MRRGRIALGVVALVAFAAVVHAQPRGPLAIAITNPMSCCVDCAFTTPVVSSVVARDLGSGVVEVDLFVISTTATPALTVTRSGRDLRVQIDAPQAEHPCTLRARISGVPRGSYTVHLDAVHAMHIAAPMGRVVPAGGELARAMVSVR